MRYLVLPGVPVLSLEDKVSLGRLVVYLLPMGVAMVGTISTRIRIFWLESVITNTVAVSKCCTSSLLPPNVDKQTVLC